MRLFTVILTVFFVTLEYPLGIISDTVLRSFGTYLPNTRGMYLLCVVLLSITIIHFCLNKWEYKNGIYIKTMAMSFILFPMSAFFVLVGPFTLAAFFGLLSGFSISISILTLLIANRKKNTTAGYLIFNAIPLCGLLGGSIVFFLDETWRFLPESISSYIGFSGYLFILPCLFLMLFSVVVIRVKGKVSFKSIFLHPYALTAVVCTVCLIGWPFFMVSYASLLEESKTSFLMLFSLTCLTVTMVTCGLFYLSFKTWTFDKQTKTIFRYGVLGAQHLPQGLALVPAMALA